MDHLDVLASLKTEGDVEEYLRSVVPLEFAWLADDAKTLDEIIAAVTTFLGDLHTLKADGYTLVEPIDDGRGDLRRPSGDHSAFGARRVGRDV